LAPTSRSPALIVSPTHGTNHAPAQEVEIFSRGRGLILLAGQTKGENPQTSSRMTFLPPSPQHSAAARLTADPPLAVDPGPNRLRFLYAYTSTFRLG